MQAEGSTRDMDIPPSTPAYRKIDRLLLKLLVVELIYFIVAGLAIVLAFLLAQLRLSVARLYYDLQYPIAFVVLILPALIAGTANAVGGAVGALSYLRSKAEGYPGSGLLVSWTCTATTMWIFLTVMLIVISTLIGQRVVVVDTFR
jgi:hypothetical protein